jgi:hypothetical protein
MIKFLKVSLFILLVSWLQSVTAQNTAKFECLSYDSYIKEYCSGCALRQSNFYGVKITQNKVKTYLWHPIKIETNGGWVQLEDSFGTKFRINVSNILTYNTLKGVYDFLSTCAVPEPIVDTTAYKLEMVSGSYKVFDEFLFLVQTGTTPKKVAFTLPIYSSENNTSVVVDNQTDFRITKAGNFKIDYTFNSLPTLTGQIYCKIYKNEDVVIEPLLQCLSVVTGYLDFSGSLVLPLEIGDVISMRILRPAGAVTHNVSHSNLTITKI